MSSLCQSNGYINSKFCLFLLFSFDSDLSVSFGRWQWFETYPRFWLTREVQGKTWLNFLIWATSNTKSLFWFSPSWFLLLADVRALFWHGCDDKNFSKHASSASDNSWQKNMLYRSEPWSSTLFTFFRFLIYWVSKFFVSVCPMMHIPNNSPPGSCFTGEPTWGHDIYGQRLRILLFSYFFICFTLFLIWPSLTILSQVPLICGRGWKSRHSVCCHQLRLLILRDGS